MEERCIMRGGGGGGNQKKTEKDCVNFGILWGVVFFDLNFHISLRRYTRRYMVDYKGVWGIFLIIYLQPQVLKLVIHLNQDASHGQTTV